MAIKSDISRDISRVNDFIIFVLNILSNFSLPAQLSYDGILTAL